jgi:ribosome-binding factor A
VKPPTQRQLRVAEEIRHVLSGVFQRGECHDLDLVDVQVTVTEVRLAPDMKRGTVYFARLGRSDAARLLPALKRASPFLRAQVARSLQLRHTPVLDFAVDTSLDYAMHVDGLLRRPEVARDLNG